ncbi:helix-turn-helix transcriptional regulator [Rhodoferax sp.]|uniref:helix-turn-helix domain-containing protein n=1 Tax=Rhodoferax sp. TaxID=50421 RepID=UPI0025EEA2B6|nr:helix-turn-helix transcriptional regulator [Rhodoferax sp.]
MEKRNSKCDIALAVRQAKNLGLTQSQIANYINASQSQVSRTLSGQSVRSSKVLERLCEYVSSAASKTPIMAVSRNHDLMDAVASTWDGTPGHAQAMATVIRSLGLLTPRKPMS